METQKKQIDWMLAESTVGGNRALAVQLLHQLLEELPGHKALFEKLYQDEAWQTLGEQAHKLQGACSYCGVPLLKDAAYTLEILCKSASKGPIRLALEIFNHCIDALLAEALSDPRLQSKD